MQVSEQVALVTGGGRGLGRATALALARQGCNVVVGDTLTDLALSTAREVESTGVRSLEVVVDVSDETAVSNPVDRVLEDF